jgi:molybdenum cofactor cytidylyltransferase
MENGIIAIYLAAGKSERMGSHKLSLPFGRYTIGHSALKEALRSSLDYIFVVTKEEDSLHWVHSEIFQEPFNSKWTKISCEESVLGQAHSLRCGLLAALARKPKGIMVLLGDQPLLSVTTIDHLIHLYESHLLGNENLQYVAASLQGIPRPPIIFSQKAATELMTLTGDDGAKTLLQKKKLTGIMVNYENERDFLDIDTPQDYEALKEAGKNDQKGGDHASVSSRMDP